MEKPPSGVRLQDCTIEYLPESEAAKWETRRNPLPLSEINPSWRDPKQERKRDRPEGK
jgi:hypothetical protein